MADETLPVLDLDKIDEATDEAAIQAELAKVRQAPATTDAATGAAADEVTPPAEAPAVATAKPAEETSPAKPAEPEVKPRVTDDKAWKRIRMLEDQIEALQAERAKPAEVVVSKMPEFSDDPAEHLLAKTNQLENEVKRLREKEAYDTRINNIRAQESDFERVKPDYKKALEYLENAEVKDWMTSGVATVGINQLSNAVAAGKRGDAAYKQYADHVANVAGQKDIRDLAEKEGRDPEDVAIWMTARDTYLTSRRQMVWQGAEATGRSAAEIAYDLALARGYTPAQAAAAASAAVDDGAAAKDSVTRQKLISEAANSLSESASADTPAQPKVLHNRAEVINLDTDSLDALIASGQYRQL